MLKIVVVALALSAVLTVRAKFVPAEWTHPCAESECLVGP
jgi:hypothetical protein